jgi:hypothetical protein
MLFSRRISSGFCHRGSDIWGPFSHTPTQRRTLKPSARYYTTVIATHGEVLDEPLA